MDETDEVAKAGYEWWHSGSKWENDASDPVKDQWRGAANRVKGKADELRKLPDQVSPLELGEFAYAGFSGSHEGWDNLSEKIKVRWQSVGGVIRRFWDALEAP
jgi:hypothetical protein